MTMPLNPCIGLGASNLACSCFRVNIERGTLRAFYFYNISSFVFKYSSRISNADKGIPFFSK